jgi:hypothetical protein
VKCRPDRNTSNIIYIKYIQSMFPKVELVEETKEGKNGGKIDCK